MTRAKAGAGTGPGVDTAARLKRRALQFLVHSFLYYRLDEPVIPDEAFDEIVRELRRLRAAHPKAEIPHAKLVDGALGPEDTAFQIRHYPPEVITAAFKLLYAQQQPEVGFVEFVERRGYRAHLAHEEKEK
jgi:NAD-dependent DNA ligase